MRPSVVRFGQTNIERRGENHSESDWPDKIFIAAVILKYGLHRHPFVKQS